MRTGPRIWMRFREKTKALLPAPSKRPRGGPTSPLPPSPHPEEERTAPGYLGSYGRCIDGGGEAGPETRPKAKSQAKQRRQKESTPILAPVEARRRQIRRRQNVFRAALTDFGGNFRRCCHRTVLFGGGGGSGAEMRRAKVLLLRSAIVLPRQAARRRKKQGDEFSFEAVSRKKSERLLQTRR